MFFPVRVKVFWSTKTVLSDKETRSQKRIIVDIDPMLIKNVSKLIDSKIVGNADFGQTNIKN